MSERAPIAAPEYGMPEVGFGDPLEGYFPPEKERVDVVPSDPKHAFEVEDRRGTDWPRRRAFLVDCLLLSAVFFLIRQGINGYVGAGVFTTALALTYFFVMEATRGQTVGKRMMRLRVVMRDGRPAPANAVAARTVFRLLDGFPGSFLIGGLVMLLSGKRRQRLGDLVAGTIVRKDDRFVQRAPHSVLVGVYPMLWIGVALAVMWQVNLFGPHLHVEGKLTSNPYMRKVDRICERRLVAEWRLGSRETEEDAARLWTQQMGAIDSLPPAQRTVIALRDIEGWPPEDVCEALELTQGNQRVLLHRARTRVRERLERHFGAVEATVAV
jgi:uncharacterized RDD family membrane protein YckC